MFISPDADPLNAQTRDVLVRTVRAECAPPAAVRAYALLDAACDPGLIDRLYALPDLRFDCALPGDVAPDEFHVAPFFVDLGPQLQALDSLLDLWSRAGCCLCLARAMDTPDLQFDRLLAVFRNLGLARDERGAPLRVRFWDPRVLPVLLEQLPGDLWADCFSDTTGLQALLYPSALGRQLLRTEFQGGSVLTGSTSLGAQIA